MKRRIIMIAAHFLSHNSLHEEVGDDHGGHGGGDGVPCGGGGGQSQTDRQVGGKCEAPPEDRREVKH